MIKLIITLTKAFIFMNLISCSSGRYFGPKSDHFDGERFFNPTPYKEKTFLDVLKWQLTKNKKKWPDQVTNIATPEIKENTHIESNQVHVTFINHATFLLQLKNINILTDPIWSERASPVQFLGPKRVRPPGLAFEQLPPIDIVLISHNHFDHMDKETIKRLEQKFSPQFIVGLGDKVLLQSFGVKNVIEMDWWQETRIKNLTITYTPAQHFSARSLTDRFYSLWGGFMITNELNQNIYFSGDTGLSSYFSDIKKKFTEIHLAFLPIGAYEPRDFMKDNHTNPDDAVKAHLILEPNLSIGKHFGTFQLTDEGFEDPKIDLQKAKKENNINENSFITLNEGESRTLLLKTN